MINLKFTQTINKPIGDVWRVVAEEFTEANKWAYGTQKCRKGREDEGFDRIAETESGTLMDTITTFDKENFILEFSVKGLPFFVRSVVSTWTLKRVSANETEITLGPRIKVMPVLGALLQIPMKRALNKLYPELINDLKIYIETGKPSPRKQEEINSKR